MSVYIIIMCYNYEVSMGTFIIGTLFQIISNLKHPMSIYATPYVMSILSMQLWEALMWQGLDYTRIAQITTFIQPLVLMLHPNILKNNNWFPVLLLIGIHLYMNWNLLYDKVEFTPGKFSWVTNTNFFVYFGVTTFMIMLLYDHQLVASNLLLYLFSFIVPLLLMKKGDGVPRFGSLWCWVSAFFPLLYFIMKSLA